MKKRAEVTGVDRRRWARLMGLLIVALALLVVLIVMRRTPVSATAVGRTNGIAARRDHLLMEQAARDEQRERDLQALVDGMKAGPREYAELAALQSAREPAKAQSLLEGATRRFPKSISLWAGLARVHQQQGRPDRAILAFRKATALDASNALVAAAFSNLYTTLGWANEARKVLNPALKKHPTDPSLLMSLSRLERQSANGRAARKAVENLASQDGAPVQVHVLMAQALVTEGNRTGAAAAFGKALAREPWNSEVRGQLALLLTDIGTKEALTDAEILLREALDLQSNPGLQRALGITLSRQKRHAEALELLLPLTDHNSDSLSLTTVANSLRAENRVEEAQSAFAKASETTNAEGEFRRILTSANFRPRDPEPPVALARHYLRQKRDDFARAEVLRTLLIDSHHPGAGKLARELDVSTSLTPAP